MSNNEISEGFNMTKLGLLPDGWEVVKLGDVTEKTKQKDPRKTPGWRFKYVDVSSISRDALKIAECKLCHGKDAPSRAKKLVKRNDVIFATVRPTLKRLALIDEEFDGEICSTAFCILRATEHILNPLYLFYAVQRDVFIDEFEKVQRGASYPAITDSDVKNQSIPLPPLPEQHRIAAVLSAVQDAKENTGAVIAAAKSLKKSLMCHLFTYGPVSIGVAESVPLVDTEIGLVPEGWAVVRLGEVAEKTKQKDPRKIPEWRFRYIDVSSINRETLKIAEYKLYQGKDAPSRAKKLVKNKDVIFATVRPTLKRLTLINEEFDGEICSTAFCVLKARENILNPLYMFYAVQRDIFIDELEKIQRGVSYPAITDSDVKNQNIPLPPPPTQQKIVSILSTVDKKIEAEENKKKALYELFRSLLHNLMTAKIRVNHLEVGK